MFKLDSPLMNFLNKVADIMILNILFIFFSIPVITIGASYTAAYYICFKMVKNEESYIIRGFWKAFRENFKQATIIWLAVLVIGGILFADYQIMHYSGVEFADWMKIGIVSVTVIMLMGASYLFPLQARFFNPVKSTIKNAFLMALSHLPTSFALIIVYALPAVIYLFIPQILPALFLLAFGIVIYFKSFLLLRVFKRYEEALVAKQEPDESSDPDGGIFAESELIESQESVTVDKSALPEKVYRDGKFVEVSENSSNIHQ